MAGSPMLVAAVVLSCLLSGGLLTALPTLEDVARNALRLPQQRRTGFGASFTVALLAGLIVGGLLVEAWGLFDVLILSAIAGCVGLALLGLTRHEGMTLTAAALTGLGAGMLHTSAAAAMPVAFFVGKDAADRASLGKIPAATNLGYVFVVLGALGMPFLVRALLKKFGFRSALQALALVAVLPAIVVIFSDRHANYPPARDEISLALLFGDLRFWVAALGVFLLTAVEASVLQWATKYLDEIGYAPRRHLGILLVFWAVFLGARVLCSAVAGHVTFLWLLLALAVLSGVVLGNMVGFHTRSGGGLSFLLFAACLGPLLPTLVGLVFLAFPRQPAAAFGLIGALGAGGWLLAEPLMRRQVARDRTRLAMGITMVLVLVAAVPALLLLVLPAG